MTASRIAPEPHEEVTLNLRRHMTSREKAARWLEFGRCCAVCGELVSPTGPEVIWDHRVALALGGSNELANMEPHHAETCAAVKTARDRKAIAKAKRLARDFNKETRRKPTRPMRGRNGFRKELK